MNSISDGGMISIDEAAMRLAVSTQTIRRLISDGSLPAYAIGGARHTVRISVRELERALLGWETRGGATRGGATR